MSGKTAKTADEVIAFVLGHPIRVEALRILNARDASVAELAREMREDAKKVGNHVKALLDHGCIEWTRTAKRRGAYEHFYKGSGRRAVSREEWEGLPPADRLRISAHLFLGAAAEGLAAIRTGRIDGRLDRHLSYKATVVDQQAWSELITLLDEAARRAENIFAAARRRDPEAQGGIPVMLTLVGAEGAGSAGTPTASSLALPRFG